MVLPPSNVPVSPWVRVYEALANRKYNFRTVDGIVRDTGLPVHEVQNLLSQHEHEIRIAHSTDKEGHLLYTLRDRPKSLQEIPSNVQSIITSTTSS